ncbi:MAG: DinB family protein [Cyclobacteriaceae bacterium]|nr:DinB family protein [Cyclobacteriaceae bacterium HetDA_MAG_MS6]
MQALTAKLQQLIQIGMEYLPHCSKEQLMHKPAPEKWSKMEILGHLIDSGIYNLQRLTEIEHSEKPYQVKTYQQNELVTANDYQHSNLEELLSLWTALNARIAWLISKQTGITLSYSIILPDGMQKHLEFLIKDYLAHMQHHLDQITSKVENRFSDTV